MFYLYIAASEMSRLVGTRTFDLQTKTLLGGTTEQSLGKKYLLVGYWGGERLMEMDRDYYRPRPEIGFRMEGVKRPLPQIYKPK